MLFWDTWYILIFFTCSYILWLVHLSTKILKCTVAELVASFSHCKQLRKEISHESPWNRLKHFDQVYYQFRHRSIKPIEHWSILLPKHLIGYIRICAWFNRAFIYFLLSWGWILATLIQDVLPIMMTFMLKHF